MEKTGGGAREGGAKIIALEQMARVTRRFKPKGAHRLLTTVYSPERRAANHFEVIRPYGNNLRMLLDTSSFIEWQIFFYGRYEPEIVELIRETCKPGGTAIDAGANVGCHALIMAECAGEQGRVIALEPHARVFERLRANVAMNGLQQIETLRTAAGAESGTMQLYAPASTHHGAGKATMYEGNLALDPYAASAMECADVPVTTIDRVMFERECERLDLIKIDVEGHEMPVLRGARETIARFRPSVIFEYTAEYWLNAGANFADVRAFFEVQRYELRYITPKGPRPFEHVANGNYVASPA
ncbi:MAG: FkbM family methyltransferase [Dehalococcoidia bacterium]